LHKLLENEKITYCNNESFVEEENNLVDESNDANDIDSEDIENTNDGIFVDTNTNNDFVEDNDALTYFLVQTYLTQER